jgi:hypothetical protein
VSAWEISRIGTRMSGREPFDVDLARIGQRGDRGFVDVGVGGEEFFVGVHETGGQGSAKPISPGSRS